MEPSFAEHVCLALVVEGVSHGWAIGSLLATDGAGSLYLVGVEHTADDSAALFYLRWDGKLWTDRESLPLGFTADSAL